MAGGIHEADKSISRLVGRDTSDHRIRKTVKGTGKSQITVYKVDNSLTQIWRKTLSSIGLGKEPKYLDAEGLKKLSDTIGFKSIKETSPFFTLAVISLKKELRTTDNPEAILEKYSPEVRKTVVTDCLSGIADPENFKKYNDIRLEKGDIEFIRSAYADGIDFETGNQNLEQVADRIMNSDDPAKTMDAHSLNVLERVYRKSKGITNYTALRAGGSVKNELLATLKSGSDIRTTKPNLGQAADRIMNSDSLQFYNEKMKKDLLNNISGTKNVQYILKNRTKQNASTDEKLKTLMDYGIDLGTGKVANSQKLKAKLHEDFEADYMKGRTLPNVNKKEIARREGLIDNAVDQLTEAESSRFGLKKSITLKEVFETYVRA